MSMVQYSMRRLSSRGFTALQGKEVECAFHTGKKSHLFIWDAEAIPGIHLGT